MNKLKEGISLRKIHNWLIVIAVVLSAFMIYSTYRLTSNFMHVRDALNENIALESAIDSLMEASDYLTENAQRFTVHGDRRYMDQYFKEALNSKRCRKRCGIPSNSWTGSTTPCAWWWKQKASKTIRIRLNR